MPHGALKDWLWRAFLYGAAALLAGGLVLLGLRLFRHLASPPP